MGAVLPRVSLSRGSCKLPQSTADPGCSMSATNSRGWAGEAPSSTTLQHPDVLAMFSPVSILALYEMAVSRELVVAIRITPMLDGYAVRVQVGGYRGPCPRFEKHFPPGTPVEEAVERMAKYPLDFFNMGRGGVPRE